MKEVIYFINKSLFTHLICVKKFVKLLSKKFAESEVL